MHALLTDAPFGGDEDSQVAQTVLDEIRAFRLELRNTAATIQRLQIVMYRLQAQGAILDRATNRLEMVRGTCTQARDQQKLTAAELEQMKKQSWPNGVDQKAVEQSISQMQSTMEMWASRAQLCQGEQADAEAQFRVEHQRLEQRQRLIESGVRQIWPYVDKLSAKWEFDQSTYALARELEKPVRAGLEQELRGSEDSEEVDSWVRRLVASRAGTLTRVTASIKPLCGWQPGAEGHHREELERFWLHAHKASLPPAANLVESPGNLHALRHDELH